MNVDIPDDIPAEYLAGHVRALRADDPADEIDGLEKREVINFIDAVLEVDDDVGGEANNNVTTGQLRAWASALAEEL